jgi:hypothetical protein
VILIFLQIIGINKVSGQPSNKVARDLLKTVSVTYPFSFAIISDPHIGKDNDECPIRNCSLLYAVILNGGVFEANPKFVICTGDLTNDGTEDHLNEYASTTKSFMEMSRIPVFSLPGNHDFLDDSDPDKTSHYYYGYHEKIIDTVKYSDVSYNYYDYYFDYGNYRFILLDDVQKKSGKWSNDNRFEFTGTQQATLESWLNTDQICLVFAHIPSYKSGDYFKLDNLHSLLSESNERASFFGHNHELKSLCLRCIGDYPMPAYFIAPSTWDTLQEKEGDIEEHTRYPGWLLVTIYEAEAPTQCNLTIDFHQIINEYTEWVVSREFPTPAGSSIEPVTLEEFKIYLDDEITFNDYTVGENGCLNLFAGEKIMIKPTSSFKVVNGGRLRAIIDPCIKNSAVKNLKK